MTIALGSRKVREVAERAAAERERTAAVIEARIGAARMLRTCAADRSWKRASDTMVWAAGLLSGLACVIVLASWGGFGIEASWSAAPSLMAGLCALAAALARDGRTYDVADAVVCEEALEVLNWLVESGLSSHEGAAALMRRYKRRFDRIENVNESRRKLKRVVGAAPAKAAPATTTTKRMSITETIRKHERIVPINLNTTVTVDGVMQHAAIIDVSRSGVALTTSRKIGIGKTVLVGRTRARTVRDFRIGIGLEFEAMLPEEAFSADIRL